jgi:hypothetical protein
MCRTFVQRLHAFHGVRHRYGTGWCDTCYLSCCCCCGGGCCGCRLMLLLLLLLLLLDLGMVRVVSVLLEGRSWRHAARRTGRSVRRCSWSLSKTQKKLLFNSQFDIVQTRAILRWRLNQSRSHFFAVSFLRLSFHRPNLLDYFVPLKLCGCQNKRPKWQNVAMEMKKRRYRIARELRVGYQQ